MATASGITVQEATSVIRKVVERAIKDGAVKDAHSCKRTTLHWCALAGIDLLGDSLATATQTLRMITGAQNKQEVSEARQRNDVITNLPSLAAFAEKADGRSRSRWVCSGDKAQDSWGETATTDLDPGLLSKQKGIVAKSSSGAQLIAMSSSYDIS
eukprot:2920090-Amphidinium_carterae.4